MECYVRGMSNDAIYSVNNKVNRALAGTAASMGANGYLIARVHHLLLMI